ncbi:MAG: hypothetical protein HYV26_10065, partial [Candidatus Hydrogenedentes bacterium]|nr:hypothetical protein [Candidatus Hydrogenedentota bacterium]
GSGLQVTNDVAATRGEPLILDAEQESELFFYSSAPKNCFRLETPSAGTLHIEGVTGVPVHLPGEAGWDYEAAEKRQQPLWDMRWVVEGSSLVRLSASWGIGAAHRDFLGRKEIHAADASADFGPFFTQMCLGCLTFNLLRTDGNGILPRASVVTGGEPEDVIAPAREIAWACEFLYLLDPKATAELLQDAIAWLAQRTCAQSPQANREMHNEEAALLLLMAGRYHKLTGDAKALKGHLPVLRTCGEHLLSLRREHEAMPIVHHTWDAQGVIQGKEPYFIALCFAGLQRLGSLEEALGDFSFAKAWTDAARAIQFAAISPFLDGGLWHAERSVFINYLDFRDPALASPHDQNWARSLLQMRPAIRQEYVHYETILPFWLELVEDPNQIQRAFEWIDGEYTYASGRGGATFPPFVQRNFVALVDVCLRQKHGIEGAARLLQLVLDRALDGGIPLTAAPFGAYSGSGPDTEAPGMFRHSRSGQFWDNSPFFALVLNIHYGLDYSHEGWHIGAPKPLENYPLSRVTNLCHKHAVYAITWQGRGRVKRITLDGKTYHDDVLREPEGEHEVVVFLT